MAAALWLQGQQLAHTLPIKALKTWLPGASGARPESLPGTPNLSQSYLCPLSLPITYLFAEELQLLT